jgi:hypothetical protein
MLASGFRGGANLWRAEIRPTREALWGTMLFLLEKPSIAPHLGASLPSGRSTAW